TPPCLVNSSFDRGKRGLKCSAGRPLMRKLMAASCYSPAGVMGLHILQRDPFLVPKSKREPPQVAALAARLLAEKLLAVRRAHEWQNRRPGTSHKAGKAVCSRGMPVAGPEMSPDRSAVDPEGAVRLGAQVLRDQFWPLTVRAPIGVGRDWRAGYRSAFHRAGRQFVTSGGFPRVLQWLGPAAARHRHSPPRPCCFAARRERWRA